MYHISRLSEQIHQYIGFLEKRGRSRNYSFSKSWAVKYVVVNIENSLLQYYDDPKEIGRGRYPKGQMQLSGAVLQRVIVYLNRYILVY